MTNCTNCGFCCEEYGANLGCATDADLDRWRNRLDIMQYCGHVGFGIYDLWINPVTRDEVHRCPFLRYRNGQSRCDIYEFRPDVCRDYKCENKTAIDKIDNGR